MLLWIRLFYLSLFSYRSFNARTNIHYSVVAAPLSSSFVKATRRSLLVVRSLVHSFVRSPIERTTLTRVSMEKRGIWFERRWDDVLDTRLCFFFPACLSLSSLSLLYIHIHIHIFSLFSDSPSCSPVQSTILYIYNEVKRRRKIKKKNITEKRKGKEDEEKIK